MEISANLLLYRDLGIALLAGLLIGIERGWTLRERKQGSRVAGVRTFGLLSGYGGVIAVVAQTINIWIAGILAATVTISLAISYVRSIHDPDGHSITNFVVSLLTLSLGMLAGSGQPALAIAGAAIVTALLSMRSELHGLLRKIGPTDVKAIARFAIIAGAILPLLPDQAYGPYDAWNPQKLWIVVVLVTGLSLVGYVANRIFGAAHGTLVTAVIGGAYSSTAVTASLSQRMRDDDDNRNNLSAGIALASSVMYLRVALLTLVLAQFAFVWLVIIIAPAAIISLIFGLLLLRNSETRKTDQAVETRNPVNLLPALFFALTVAIMLLATRWAEARFGSSGIALLTFIGGSLDVDAAIVTLGQLPENSISAKLAGFVLAMTVLANMVFKTFVAGFAAGWNRARPAVIALATSSMALAVSGFIGFLLFDIRFR